MEILKENNKNFAKKNRENMSQASYFSFNPFVPDPEHINGIDSYLLMIQAKIKICNRPLQITKKIEP